MPSRVREVAAASAIAAITVVARLRPFQNPDVLWQIRTGDAVLATHRRVPVDLFSYAFRGRPIHDHEPAFEALVALVDRAGGLRLLWWLGVALAVVGVIAAFRAARRLEADPHARLLATAVVVAAAGTRLELRAEAASFFAIALAHALRSREPASWARRLSPVACAVFAAPFHGLALLVAVVPMAHAAASIVARRSLKEAAIDVAIAIATAAAAELVMPGMIANVFANAEGKAFAAHILEGYSPLAFLTRGHDATPLVALSVAALSVAVLAVRRRWADAFLVLALLLPGLRYVRFSFLAAVAAMPSVIGGLATLLAPFLARLREALRIGLAAVACAASLFVATEHFGDGGPIIGFDWRRQPIEAVAWLAAHRPDARLFHPYNFGAYLVYARYPPRGVVIDPRAATVYPDDYAARYYAAVSDPKAFEAWVADDATDTVLLQEHHASSAPVRAYLARSPEWRAVYVDEVAIVFVRK